MMDGLIGPLLLGNDFLKRHKAILNYDKGEITLKNEFGETKVRMLESEARDLEANDFPSQDPLEQPQVEHQKWLLSSDVTIPPGDETDCKVEGPTPVGGRRITPTRRLIEEGLSLEAVRHKGENMVATLHNHRRVPRRLLAGTTVGEWPSKEISEPEGEIERNRPPQANYIRYGDELMESTNINQELDDESKTSINNLLAEYQDVFAWTPAQMGRTNLVEHSIELTNDKPIHLPPYRVSHAEKEIIRDQVDEMLELGVIRPSTSSWSAPVVLVKKKDGGIRFCVDYRKLNAITRKDVYPLPVIDDLLSHLGNARYFTSLDLLSGYWQIPIKEEDKDKTAFITPDGLYEFNVLPFGLTCAPASFQHLVDTVLAGLKWKKALVYLDDIIVKGETFEEMVNNLRAVLNRLREAGLTLKPSKCHFGMTEIGVLGHIVNRDGIAPDPNKVKAIKNFPPPKKLKDVQSFLGLANYYRKFIKDFSKIAKPLHSLTKKDVKFNWDENARKAFEHLKNTLISAPVLAHFDPNAPTEVRVDACGYGVGAILLQGEKPRVRPVAYASRTLSKAEQNYSITEKECLAAVWALNYFRPYIWGKRVTIVTDHHSLCWLKSVKDPAGRLARWSLRLMDYDYEIRHKSGRLHSDADCLSRYPASDPTPKEVDEVEEIPLLALANSEVATAQKNDPDLQPILRALENPEAGEGRIARQAANFLIKDGLLLRKNAGVRGNQYLTVIPKSLQREIMYSHHDEPLSGHLGFSRTYDKIKNRYYWIGMKSDILKYVRGCPDCQSRKGPNQKTGGFLQPIQAGRPFEKIGVDLLGPFRRSKNGKVMIVVATDYGTRWAETKALPNGTAEPVAKFLLENIICRHGAPKTILTDRGRVFQSEVIRNLLKSMGIVSSFTTAYRPQTNGLTERLNKTLAEMLSAFTNDQQKDWDEFLPQVTFAYNTTKQGSLGETPYFLVHGREAKLPSEIMMTLEDEGAWSKERERLDEARKVALERLETRQKKEAKRYDESRRDVTFKPGDLVRVHTPTRKIGKSTKLLPQYHGPYKVIKQVGPVNYEIEKGRGKKDVVHVARMSKYYQRDNYYNLCLH